MSFFVYYSSSASLLYYPSFLFVWMTGFVDRKMPISKLIIASLEDIGYTVDYSAADEYDGNDTVCCNPSIHFLPSTPSKPPLSDLGKDTAVAYGRGVLSESFDI